LFFAFERHLKGFLNTRRREMGARGRGTFERV